MTYRARHLDEEQLNDCYLAQRDGNALDPRALEHLADCSECGSKFTDLSQFMDTLRSDAEAEADEWFPAEWRRRQQQHIAARLDHLGHMARVISFPARSGDETGRVTSRVAPRWVAAAAAAGLFVGMALGNHYDLGRTLAFGHGAPTAVSNQARVSASPAVLPAAPEPAKPAPAGLDDDAFLSELELSVDSLQAHELMPFYAFTPSVIEASAQLR
jgi:hypothetical protein